MEIADSTGRIVAEGDDEYFSGTAHLRTWLPAGRYVASVWADSVATPPGGTPEPADSTYTLTARPPERLLHGCQDIWVARGLAIEADISYIDCWYGWAGMYSDQMMVRLAAGDSLTVTMRSSEIPPHLMVIETGRDEEAGEVPFERTAAPGTDGARLAFTAPRSATYVLSTYTTGGLRGAYSLEIR